MTTFQDVKQLCLGILKRKTKLSEWITVKKKELNLEFILKCLKCLVSHLLLILQKEQKFGDMMPLQ